MAADGGNRHPSPPEDEVETHEARAGGAEEERAEAQDASEAGRTGAWASAGGARMETAQEVRDKGAEVGRPPKAGTHT